MQRRIWIKQAPAVYMLNTHCLSEGLVVCLGASQAKPGSSKNIWPLAEMLEPA